MAYGSWLALAWISELPLLSAASISGAASTETIKNSLRLACLLPRFKNTVTHFGATRDSIARSSLARRMWYAETKPLRDRTHQRGAGGTGGSGQGVYVTVS